MIKLFEVEKQVVKPTEHCYQIKWLKAIIDEYPDAYLNIFAYLFYMSCPSEENPFFNLPEAVREDAIEDSLDMNFDTEDDMVQDALDKTMQLYETPTVRAHKGIKTMLDNLTEYMETTGITAGRDGNISALLRIAEKFDSIRQSYKGVAKDLEAEQKTNVRGNQQLGYDQM